MQNRRNWSNAIESELRASLQEYIFDVPSMEKSYILAQRLNGDGQANHNYQRESLRAQAKLAIYYLTRMVAIVDKTNRVVEISPRKAEDGSKTFYIQKLLEKVLYYDYMDFRVVK